MHRKWITVLQAADTATRWNVSQKRKGENAEPDINHLLHVAAMVTEANDGKEPSLYHVMGTDLQMTGRAVSIAWPTSV